MEQKTQNKKTQVRVSFAALDPYIESNILSGKESIDKGKDMVIWGDRNLFPYYLLTLYQGSPTLRAIIQGSRDFVVGDDQALNGVARLNDKQTPREFLEAAAEDMFIYDGVAFEVIRDKTGAPVQMTPIPTRYIRTNKERSVFYYSEEWEKSRHKVLEYPAFMPITPEKWAEDEAVRKAHGTSILFVCRERNQVYPFPIYGASLKACETERCIGEFHLNGICNNFSASAMINFNNGVPTDDVKEEIEKAFTEKFTGAPNAARVMFSWNANKDSATTIDVPKVEDFGEKYQSLEKSVRQQIFTAFRANPNLFGIPTENLGFSQEEYESAFKLYNRTCIRPVQRLICDAVDRVFGMTGVLTIKPFTIEGETETNVQ